MNWTLPADWVEISAHRWTHIQNKLFAQPDYTRTTFSGGETYPQHTVYYLGGKEVAVVCSGNGRAWIRPELSHSLGV